MKSLEQETDSGQTRDPKEKLSQPASPRKKTKSAPLKESPISQSTNGLPNSETKKKNSLESASVSGDEPTPKAKKAKSLMPVPKLPLEEQKKRAEQALKRLKVKPQALSAAPPITSLIKKTVKGGLKVALEAMRFASDDLEIQSFLKVYDKIPVGDRDRLPWEAITISAKVNPKHLVGAVQLAVQTYCANKSRFIAVSNHPDTTKARVKYAKMPSGERDRTQLDIMVGALPSAKGPTFIGKAVFGGGPSGGSKGGDKDDDDDAVETVKATYESDEFGDLFPAPSEVQDKLVPIRQRLLESK